MRLATVRLDGKVRFGAVIESGFIDLGARFGGRCADLTELLRRGALDEAAALCANASPDAPLDRVEFLPVLARPDTRVFALGWAYKEHQVETGKEAPSHPSLFTKFPSTLVGHGQPLVKPSISDTFDYEGEVAVIIGKAGRHIKREAALDHIAGFSILMDGSCREWQKHSVTAGKNFDASSSFGPWMVTRDEIPEPGKMRLTTRLNGQVMQQSPFEYMVWELGFLLNYLSTVTELQPGDVISTGTPSGVGARRTPPVFMKAGDTLEVEVTGIGVLRNTVVEEGAA